MFRTGQLGTDPGNLGYSKGTIQRAWVPGFRLQQRGQNPKASRMGATTKAVVGIFTPGGRAVGQVMASTQLSYLKVEAPRKQSFVNSQIFNLMLHFQKIAKQWEAVLLMCYSVRGVFSPAVNIAIPGPLGGPQYVRNSPLLGKLTTYLMK